MTDSSDGLTQPADWHEMSTRELQIFTRLSLIADGRVARTPIVAATVLRNSYQWNMVILPQRRGTRYPVDFATLLGFSPSTYHPDKESIEVLRGATELTELAQTRRQEIRELGEPVFGQLAAYFEDPRRATDADFPTLAAFTQHFLGSSPPTGQRAELALPNGDPIQSIAVVSVGGAGGPDVARLLADGLGWGYTNLEIAASELVGVPRGADEEQGYSGQVEAVEHLLQNLNGQADAMVWSYNEIEPIRATISTVARWRTQGVLIVWIVAPESLIDWTVREWSKNKSELMATQQIIEEAVNEAEQSGRAVKLTLPDLDVPMIPHDTDALFDAYVEMAFAAFQEITRRFSGPDPAVAQGELEKLFRLRDQSTHD